MARRSSPRVRPVGIAALLLVAGCVAPRVPPPVADVAPPPPAPRAYLPPPPAAAAPEALRARIAELGRGFDGVVGIAVRDVGAGFGGTNSGGGWAIGYGEHRALPQQSVSKLWVAITLLDAVDRGVLRLEDEVVVRHEDLTLFHQPIAALVGDDGYRTTIADLLTRAMTMSDNSANDKLLGLAGGPAAVRAKLARAGIAGIRFGPGERLLQSRTAGLAWRQDYATGDGFERAREALPPSVRRAALDAYLLDPIDGAEPAAVVDALARLGAGTLLSPASTRELLALMAASRTGPERMRAGLDVGWTLAHKTGTGQELDGLATGYNDVGLLTAPDGRMIAVAVMIGSTRRTIPVRQRLMADVVRAVIAAEDGASGVTR